MAETRLSYLMRALIKTGRIYFSFLLVSGLFAIALSVFYSNKNTISDQLALICVMAIVWSLTYIFDRYNFIIESFDFFADLISKKYSQLLSILPFMFWIVCLIVAVFSDSNFLYWFAWTISAIYTFSLIIFASVKYLNQKHY